MYLFNKVGRRLQKKWDEFIREQEKILNEIIFNHPNVSQYVNEKFIDNGMIKKRNLCLLLKTENTLSVLI